jgi:tetratricopeptide (TPR) repeat protein
MPRRPAHPGALLAALIALAPAAVNAQHTPALAAAAGARLPEEPRRDDARGDDAGDPLRRADALWKAGDHPAARQAYAEAVRADSSQSRAVFRLAMLLAWDGRTNDAIPLYRLYRRLEPRDTEGAIAHARALAWGGRFGESVAVDDSVLAADATYRDAALDAAQTLAWAGRFGPSAARYRAWLAAHPDDADAELALARTLSWAGRLRDAERIYDRRAAAGSAEAAKGKARVAAWRGDLSRSLALWESLARTRERDPEVWTGIGQVQRWMGRPRAADAALRRALAAQPGYRDAVQQRRWVRPELAAGLAPSVVYGTDSDRNTSTFASVQAALPPWGDARVTVQASARDARFGAVEARARAARAVVAWAPRPGVLVRAEGGAASAAARRDGAATAARVRPRAGASVGLALPLGAGLSLGASRAPFDETAPLIERGLVATAADAGLDVPLGGRLSASVSAGRTALSGGSVPNVRTGGGAGVRWRVARPLSLGLARRAFGYARSPRDGYFAPRRFALTEASARGGVGGELGWRLDAELGVGRQVLHFGEARAARAVERGSLALAWRPAPGAEFALSVGGANVASPAASGTAGSEYHAWTTGLRARVPVGAPRR